MFNLDEKIAIVTGANTGLGQGMALALARAGAKVAGIFRSDISETEEKMTACGVAPRNFLAVQVDLAAPDAPEQIFSAVKQQWNSVDIIVNNAGIIRRNDAVDYSEDDWDEVLDINLKKLFLLSRRAAKEFMAQGRGGKIINVASLLSYQGGVRVAAYTASKHGVEGLTKALANEWAGLGINVNGIAPGYMVTNNTQALREDPERYRAILERIPAGRWGTPADLGGAVVFLASAAGDYVHGFTIAVDGGWLGR
ncbi:2-dehydro-3-deoxy-D-gluconate 5-dehydrogenase KduD [Candidatus Haliotispira prima]|uniref:2-dehydro-3-deoxy-D-gluconate 5-dehydrogenase KduD n=1 Tax=Candidatus Haliotispira prima TaxID=3034016 RepID=A0ABY8MKE1_9SPIO|nr:2-dehydro-3-deoxy-D-gluconate 5-dehydrogenase KduD [Candidatus Haliotispira prima]